ncbi:hypothetical protein [Alkalibacillus almallahensis]|uniref:hypothetical protein n=1 Tax=Alkalibacillus almallahensis TaxID=1379154 RepID=UPI00141D919D|nr:hypothetical protein [Alkalibacillus almallahensis]NIK12793.1 hypothetical protein [Alkalibacillus almallahensis]
MSNPDKIIKEIDMLNEVDRQIVLRKIKEKYMMQDSILLNNNYDWWDNEADEIYNDM